MQTYFLLAIYGLKLAVYSVILQSQRWNDWRFPGELNFPNTFTWLSVICRKHWSASVPFYPSGLSNWSVLDREPHLYCQLMVITYLFSGYCSITIVALSRGLCTWSYWLLLQQYLNGAPVKRFNYHVLQTVFRKGLLEETEWLMLLRQRSGA